MTKNIIISGTSKGCGKSTVGLGLDHILNQCEIFDTKDTLISFTSDSIIKNTLEFAKNIVGKIILIADNSDDSAITNLAGTLQLLSDEEKQLILGVIVNNNSTDQILSIEAMENLLNTDVLGIIPHSDINLDEPIHKFNDNIDINTINICIISLPSMIITNDIKKLESNPQINIKYSDKIENYNDVDLFIIPDTTNVIGDCQHLNRIGISNILATAKEQGKFILGLGGGYQIMAQTISDEYRPYSAGNTFDGMNLLPLKTVMEKDRLTYSKNAIVLSNIGLLEQTKGVSLTGIEINMGYTAPINMKNILPSLVVEESSNPYYGGVSSKDGKIIGMNFINIFDNQDFTNQIMSNIMKSKGLNYEQTEINNYDLANLPAIIDLIKANIDIEKLTNLLGRGDIYE